jgi:hypothetical protein
MTQAPGFTRKFDDAEIDPGEDVVINDERLKQFPAESAGQSPSEI